MGPVGHCGWPACARIAESRRPLSHHTERAFQRDPRVDYGAFFEEATNQRYAVGDAARSQNPQKQTCRGVMHLTKRRI